MLYAKDSAVVAILLVLARHNREVQVLRREPPELLAHGFFLQPPGEELLRLLDNPGFHAFERVEKEDVRTLAWGCR